LVVIYSDQGYARGTKMCNQYFLLNTEIPITVKTDKVHVNKGEDDKIMRKGNKNGKIQ
jgi:hypothetical protein